MTSSDNAAVGVAGTTGHAAPPAPDDVNELYDEYADGECKYDRHTPEAGFVEWLVGRVHALTVAEEEATAEVGRLLDAADYDARTAALDAAARLMTSVEIEPDPLGEPMVRDLEQMTVGMAERLAGWIATGRYDWVRAGTVPTPDAEDNGHA